MTRSYRFPVALLLLLCAALAAPGQTNPNFNITLDIDYSAAEGCVDLFGEEMSVNTEQLAGLRGNLIAASTTGHIADRGSVIHRLRDYLDSLKYRQIIGDDVYHLEEARQMAPEIAELLGEMKRRNFTRRVVATVEQIFPADAHVSTRIPLYAVALGHENVDAYVRRIVWKGNVPHFVGEEEGELTIVINLAQAIRYGPDVETRYLTLLGVVAHEVFHAAFGVFKERSPEWQSYYDQYESGFDALLDITQNEGIAYYLSLDQGGRGRLPREWNVKIREAFEAFNRNAGELLSPRTPPARIGELLRTANLSGYWESYGAMTGMFIAREIDQSLGRAALIETISAGPFDFLRKYHTLMSRDRHLPALAEKILDKIPPVSE